ncbi:hypothetical protein PanWU01x14_347300 [Parasponia andersonii]|uniref:Uncharacterized protein n=1 Tax=Parasponia andersonii TaxID=3476 RepID=A0A2P5AC02_PARAD|nr:hypothetical protein PanWU01x14_347300 [Parasponia andersonii]
MALKRLRARVLTDSVLSCCCTASISLSATTVCGGLEEKEDGNTIHLWGLSDRAELDGLGSHWRRIWRFRFWWGEKESLALGDG